MRYFIPPPNGTSVRAEANDDVGYEFMAGMADMCIAFPGGRGTGNMIAQARVRGLRVIVR